MYCKMGPPALQRNYGKSYRPQ
jgi:hypothetical protein